MNSFTTRFIIRSVLVVIGGFLVIYFLFNGMASRFINNVAEESLAVQIHNNNASNVAVFRGDWFETPLEDATMSFLDLPADTTPSESLPLAILTDTFTTNYVMINERGMIITSGNVANLNVERIGDVDLRFFLTNYYRDNRDKFTLGATVDVFAHGRYFLVRSVPTETLGDNDFPEPITPLTILFFTEVTEIVTFRQSVNQTLLITLFIVAAGILATTVLMSIKLKFSVNRLARYAEELGHGGFDAHVPELRYAEFQALAGSMAEMANMLATYEVNQKQFFQNASHELRTPLMAIQCYSEGVLADVFTPNEAADVINHEVEKMTELVSSILYLARIDHHAFNFAPISTNAFLQTCYQQLKILIENNNKTITFAPLEQDLQINVDAPLLERAVLNILTNALRYADTRIELKTMVYLQRNIFANIRQQMVRIIIFNDGVHVNEQDLPYLFDRFYKGPGGNTGIGLSITKEIITAFNGTVSAHNVEHGVEFIIELPVVNS